MGEDESTLLELGKVKPVEEEEEDHNKQVAVVEYSKGKPAGASVGDEGKGIVGSAPARTRRRRLCLACCGACCLVVLAVGIVLLILAFTVFKPRNPRIHVDDMTLDSFEISLPFTLFPLSVSFNATLGLAISVKNPNFASVKYSNSTAHMFYRGVEVGSIPIPAGHVGIRRTERIVSTVDLMADRFIDNSHFIPDLVGGSLPISTATHIAGHFKVFNAYKHHFDSSSVCNISIYISSRSISSTVCEYDLDI